MSISELLRRYKLTVNGQLEQGRRTGHHIMLGDSLQREIMEGRMEGTRKTQTAHELDDGGGGWIWETERKGTTEGVESMDVWISHKLNSLVMWFW